jgi:hypothetical protein
VEIVNTSGSYSQVTVQTGLVGRPDDFQCSKACPNELRNNNHREFMFT